MESLKQLQDRADSLWQAMVAKNDEAAEASDERAKELNAETDRMLEVHTRTIKLIDEARTRAHIAEQKDVREQVNGPGAQRAFPAEDLAENAGGIEIPGVAELRKRHRAARKVARLKARGQQVPEAVYAVALREFEVEDEPYWNAVIDRAYAGAGKVITQPACDTEQRDALTEYEKRAFASGTFLAAGTAGHGAEMVPTILHDQIFSDAAELGAMANVARFRNLVSNTTGEYSISKVVGNELLKAKILGENVDGTPDDYDTSDVSLNPRNTYVQTNFTDQMLQSGNLNLREFVETDVPLRFARSFNEWYTKGTGVGQPKGVTAITGRSTKTAAKGSISETDVHNWIAALDPVYTNGPGATCQMHPSTILALMRDRAGSGDGELKYPRTANGESIVLPFGLVPERNIDITALGDNTQAANVVLGFIGDLRYYVRVNLGSMTSEFERKLENYGYLFSWNAYQDAAPLNDKAFRLLISK